MAEARDWYEEVLDFHRKFAPDLIGTRPGIPDIERCRIRSKLIVEEWHELWQSSAVGDLPGIADGIADLIYVLIGMAITYGIDLRPVWEAVHRANMAKRGGGRREDGKILKPSGWEPPDVAGILEKQGPLAVGNHVVGEC